MRGLDGKNVIVTGGGGAIGGAICRRFADYGARVGVFDKNLDGANRIADEIVETGGRPSCRASTSPTTRRRQGHRPVRGRDGADRHPGEQCGLGPLRQLRRHHARALGRADRHQPARAAQHEPLRAEGHGGARHGRIVNIASDAGRVGSSQEAVYSACKGGIIAFTKTVAREMARKGITLNAVCPGPTDTPLLAAVAGEGERGQKVRAALIGAIPMKRVGQPEDIPGAVCFLASDDAAFITGQTISVSGGLTMHG